MLAAVGCAWHILTSNLIAYKSTPGVFYVTFSKRKWLIVGFGVLSPEQLLGASRNLDVQWCGFVMKGVDQSGSVKMVILQIPRVFSWEGWPGKFRYFFCCVMIGGCGELSMHKHLLSMNLYTFGRTSENILSSLAVLASVQGSMPIKLNLFIWIDFKILKNLRLKLDSHQISKLNKMGY